MKRILFFILLFLFQGIWSFSQTNISISNAPDCSELFITEYIHDTLQNRAIEIFNPTKIAKNLTGYFLAVSTGTNTPIYFPLEGTIQSDKTWVIVNAQADSWLKSKANQLLDNFNFSGKDAITLLYSSNLSVSVKIIDKIGNDSTPSSSWTISSLKKTGTTKNYTLTRLMGIAKGNTDWSTAQYEWYPHPIHSYGFIGWHSNGCVSRHKDEGVVKFTFLDNKKEEIIMFNCSITYDSTKINLYPQDARPESKRIHAKGGIYTFLLQSEDYKNVIISDVEVINEHTTYLNIKLTPKVSKTDNDTIKIKWVKPQIDR